LAACHVGGALEGHALGELDPFGAGDAAHARVGQLLPQLPADRIRRLAGSTVSLLRPIVTLAEQPASKAVASRSVIMVPRRST
jgi:hypothetical protein